jgi:hypothetical protein
VLSFRVRSPNAWKYYCYVDLCQYNSSIIATVSLRSSSLTLLAAKLYCFEKYFPYTLGMARFNDKTEFKTKAIRDYSVLMSAIASDMQRIADLAESEGIEAIFTTHFKSGAEALEKMTRFATEVRYAYGRALADRHIEKIELKIAEDAAKYEAANIKEAAKAIQKTRKKRSGKEPSG